MQKINRLAWLRISFRTLSLVVGYRLEIARKPHQVPEGAEGEIG